MRSIGFVLMGLVLLLMSGALVTAQDNEIPRFEPLEDCFIEMPEDVAYDCGYVIVPEFHDGRSDNTLSLGVIRLRSTSEEPQSPIFFGAGGPGGSVMSWAPYTANDIAFDASGVYGQLLASHDLVYFTQRGTQYADPFLTCPEEQEAEDELAKLQTFDEHLRLEIEVMGACRDRLVNEGVNLDAFNSLENAADVDAIREALGYDQIVFYGESYGTILGQHVMRDFPEILESVILDGTASLSITSWEEDTARKYQITLERIAALCTATPACNEAYPDFSDNLDAVFEQAQTDPLQVTRTTSDGETLEIPVNVEVLSSTLYTNLYVASNIARFPLALQEMLAGETDTFQQFFSLADSAFEEIGTMMHFAVVCSEDPVFSDDDVVLPEGDLYEIVLEHAQEGIASYGAICELINVSPIDETDENVTIDLPVLILSGALDPATPNFRSEEVAEALPNSYTFLFPYGSHVQAAPGNDCPAEIMAQFIADPSTEPDGSCIDTLPAIEFTLPDPTLADIAGVPLVLSQTYIGGEIAAVDADAPYSLTFNDDGLIIQADCNTVSASYAVDEDGTISIDLGATTLAECEPDSMADSVLAILENADLTLLLNTPEGKINFIVISNETGDSLTFSD